MTRLWFVMVLFISTASTQELVVIADKHFNDKNLTIAEIGDIFLSKQRFIDGKKILVMNHNFDHPLRHCFEETILKKSRRSLERYWQKAYYKGIRPPKVVKSTKMLFSYLDNVHPSIGYIDVNETANQEFVILYKGVCP